MEEDQDLRDIYQSTYGIIFFGTPHRGSSYAQMGVLARDIAVAAGFDARDTLIRSLKPDAEMLSLLRQEFARMLYDRAFKIYSFQEGQGFKGTYSFSRKVCHFLFTPSRIQSLRFFLAGGKTNPVSRANYIRTSRLLTMTPPGSTMLGREGTSSTLTT
jgi:hypothetical protein